MTVGLRLCDLNSLEKVLTNYTLFYLSNSLLSHVWIPRKSTTPQNREQLFFFFEFPHKIKPLFNKPNKLIRVNCPFHQSLVCAQSRVLIL